MEKNISGLMFCLVLSCFFLSCEALKPRLTVLSGNYAFQRGQYQKATIRYLKALESESYSHWIQYNLGNVYNAVGESYAALYIWRQADEEDNRKLNFAIRFNRGLLYYQLGQYDMAYESFRQALKENPASFEAKVNLELSLNKRQALQGQKNNKTKETLSGTASQGEGLGSQSRRMLEYVKRKEAPLWHSSQTSEEAEPQDW